MRDKDTGAVAELQVASKLIEMGYTVSEPINEGKYDLIAEKGQKYYRIQVKNGRMKDGAVRATLAEYTGSSVYEYDETDADLFAIYNDEHGVFVIPVEEAPQQLIHIRVEEPEQEHPSIRRGEDYRAEVYL